MHESVTVHMRGRAPSDLGPRQRRHQDRPVQPRDVRGRVAGRSHRPIGGARFRGHVKRNGIGPIYWTSCTVQECEPGRVFTFGVGPSDKALSVWGYRMEPWGAGPTSPRPSPWPTPDCSACYWAVLGWARGKHQPERHAHHPGADQGRGGGGDRCAPGEPSRVAPAAVTGQGDPTAGDGMGSGPEVRPGPVEEGADLTMRARHRRRPRSRGSHTRSGCRGHGRHHQAAQSRRSTDRSGHGCPPRSWNRSIPTRAGPARGRRTAGRGWAGRPNVPIIDHAD